MNALKIVVALFLFFMTVPAMSDSIPTSDRAERAIQSVEPALKAALRQKGLAFGSPIFMRIFKDPGVLELWVQSADGTYVHFKDYPICTFSGDLGPKLKEGDGQSPEGFYFVNAGRLNPRSRFHLSFNLGFPNAYDRHHGRTGSALMVHGDCVSVGCYAMTDPQIEEIYAMAFAALAGGQDFFRVHAFPFKLEDEALDAQRSNPWYPFWLNLKTGYDYFNQHLQPPNVTVVDGLYAFSADR